MSSHRHAQIAAIKELYDTSADLRDEIARLTAERDALRAAVERVRPVVDGLAEWFDSRADSYKRGGDEPPPLDEITGPLGVHNGSWPDYVCGDCAAALRALLADVPEVAP